MNPSELQRFHYFFLLFFSSILPSCAIGYLCFRVFVALVFASVATICRCETAEKLAEIVNTGKEIKETGMVKANLVKQGHSYVTRLVTWNKGKLGSV